MVKKALEFDKTGAPIYPIKHRQSFRVVPPWKPSQEKKRSFPIPKDDRVTIINDGVIINGQTFLWPDVPQAYKHLITNKRY